MTTYAIPNGRTVMDATLYTGNGATGRLITNNDTGTNGFLPDLTWIKCRSFSYNHNLYDSNRGAPLFLSPNLTAAESSGDLVAFNSNGFTVNQTSGYELNATGQTYVAWQWNAGSNTTVSNTSGTITSTVSANATAGFSIVKYTGNGTNGATIGHGLGVAPKMVMVKSRGSTNDWAVYHSSLTAGTMLFLNTAGIALPITTYDNGGVNPVSSSTFTTAQGAVSQNNVNGNGFNYVAYCWAQVAGFSAFGSYTGNGSSDGPFIYTGFRPAFVMYKAASGSAYNWSIYDTARDPYNVPTKLLYPNSSSAEDSPYLYMDILSNGFKIRAAGNLNENGSNYIYACFAENPLKFANAR